jgi:hypothetical protein
VAALLPAIGGNSADEPLCPAKPLGLSAIKPVPEPPPSPPIPLAGGGELSYEPPL